MGEEYHAPNGQVCDQLSGDPTAKWEVVFAAVREAKKRPSLTFSYGGSESAFAHSGN
jgi:hypothetical protein